MKRKRPTLLEGFLVEIDLFGNRKRRRLKVAEAREATRLWVKHSDIRRGKTKG